MSVRDSGGGGVHVPERVGRPPSQGDGAAAGRSQHSPHLHELRGHRFLGGRGLRASLFLCGACHR